MAMDDQEDDKGGGPESAQTPDPAEAENGPASSREEDLLEVGDARAPMIWFFLLFLPIAIGFFFSVLRESAPVIRPAAVEEAKQGGNKMTSAYLRDIPPVEQTTRGFSAMRKYECQFKTWHGQKITNAMIDEIEADARPYRLIPPGTQVKLDHDPARVNFSITDDGIIIRIWCG